MAVDRVVSGGQAGADPVALDTARAAGLRHGTKATRGDTSVSMRAGSLWMHYLLFYDVVPDYVERRAAFRAEHLAYARRAHRHGDLVLGGALADPVRGDAVRRCLGKSASYCLTRASTSGPVR
jgi:hypothetical protein